MKVWLTLQNILNLKDIFLFIKENEWELPEYIFSDTQKIDAESLMTAENYVSFLYVISERMSEQGNNINFDKLYYIELPEDQAMLLKLARG